MTESPEPLTPQEIELLDQFAMALANGIAANPTLGVSQQLHGMKIHEFAYNHAAAMLVQRRKVLDAARQLFENQVKEACESAT